MAVCRCPVSALSFYLGGSEDGELDLTEADRRTVRTRTSQAAPTINGGDWEAVPPGGAEASVLCYLLARGYRTTLAATETDS